MTKPTSVTVHAFKVPRRSGDPPDERFTDAVRFAVSMARDTASESRQACEPNAAAAVVIGTLILAEELGYTPELVRVCQLMHRIMIGFHPDLCDMEATK